jgi:DNA-binding PadR family transcriptional regulator
MEFIVLGLLMIQDLTVYQLNQAFGSGLSLIYSASYGSLLSALKKLLKLGHVAFVETVENGRNKKIYHITESGRAYFYQWMHDDIPESKLETTALSKVFFLGLITDKEDKRKILQSIVYAITEMENQLLAMSTSLSNLKLDENAMRIYGYQFKTLDYGIRSHRIAREWGQELLDEL